MLRTLCLLVALLPAAALADGPDLDKIALLHAKRGDPASAKELDALLADAMKQAPDNPQVLWRQARTISWKADTLSNDGKKAAGKEVWSLGEKIIKLSPSM